MNDIAGTLIFFSPIIDTYQTYNEEKDIKNFPYIHIGIKLISSIILFCLQYFPFKGKSHDARLTPLIHLGFYGFILSLFFACFYIYYSYKNDSNKMLKYLGIFILGNFLFIGVVSLFFKIPVISHLIVLVGYTCLTLSPFLEWKKIYELRDYKLINQIDLFGIFVFNSYVGMVFLKYKFFYFSFVVELNALLSIIETGIYFYLLYQSVNKQKTNETIDPNSNSNKMSEQFITNNPVSKDNNFVNNPFNFGTESSGNTSSSSYQPPEIKDDNPTPLV
jgi:hypothetical protein